jgi:hypothetical protein
VATNSSSNDSSNSSNGVKPAEAIAILRELRDRIPNWSPLSKAETLRLTSVAAVDKEFIAVSVSAVGTSAKVSTALGTSKEALEQQTAESAEWRQVEDEIRSLLLGVVGANLVRNHELGLTALQTYSIGRQLVRKGENGEIVAHVDQLRRMLRLGRRKQTGDAPSPAPAPHTMQ